MRIVPTLLPLAVFFALVLLFLRSGQCWRSSLLHAAIAWGVAVTAITEGLSLFGSLSAGPLLALWTILGAVLLLTHAFMRPTVPQPTRWKVILGWRLWLLVLATTTIVVADGAIALLAPPNTYDSMTYHMSRVMHWIQNGDVASYPTHVTRQLYQPPWAEFAITQFQILSRGDRLANLVQWFSLLGSLVGVSLIAKRLGGGKPAQVLSALLVAAIPMGVLEASGTKNDYVLSFWLVCFVYQMLGLGNQTDHPDGWGGWFLMGASLGLATLTKSTAYIFALPFVVWMAARCVRKLGARGILAIVVVLAVATGINSGHYSRNFRIYGSPLGPDRDGDIRYGNISVSLPSVLSIIVRNVALHVGTGYQTLDSAAEKGIVRLHTYLGIDINDPDTTWPGTAFHVTPSRLNEDFTGNPVHLVLIVGSVGMLVSLARLRRRRELVLYAVALVMAFLLFCFVLRWQPWHSRLHLPLFVLWSALIAVVLSTWQRVLYPIALVVFFAAMPSMLWNSVRPLLGGESIVTRDRVYQYFKNRPDLREPYMQVMRSIQKRGCSAIGLVTSANGFEYPLWVLAASSTENRVRIEHVAVRNQSAVAAHRHSSPPFKPCAIIALEAEVYPERAYNGRLYRSELVAGPVSLFVPR